MNYEQIRTWNRKSIRLLVINIVCMGILYTTIHAMEHQTDIQPFGFSTLNPCHQHDIFMAIAHHLTTNPDRYISALESLTSFVATCKSNHALASSECFSSLIKMRMCTIKHFSTLTSQIRHATTTKPYLWSTNKKKYRKKIQLLPQFQKQLENVIIQIQSFITTAGKDNEAMYAAAQKLISENKINPDFSINGDRMLYYAVKYSNRDLIQFLVNEGADVNHYNGDAETPLYRALRSAPWLALDLLRKYNADPNYFTKIIPPKPYPTAYYCIQPLYFDYNSHKKIFKVMVKKGFNPDNLIIVGCGPRPSTPQDSILRYSQQPLLTFAIQNNDQKMINFLLDHGADPLKSYVAHPQENAKKTTPLIEAQRLRAIDLNF